jgi:hypothetical protein
MNNTIITLIVLTPIFTMYFGFWLGRNNKPWRKTRYFTDGDFLWKWQYGKNQSQKLYQYWTVFSWEKSAKNLNWLLQNKQEITALQAYRMFPRGFKTN